MVGRSHAWKVNCQLLLWCFLRTKLKKTYSEKVVNKLRIELVQIHRNTDSDGTNTVIKIDQIYMDFLQWPALIQRPYEFAILCKF